MPLIATLCAGAARSFGGFLNFKKTPTLPEGAVLFRTDTNAVSDWSIKTDWNTYHVIGQNTAGNGTFPSSGSWGVKQSSQGRVVISFSTSSAGAHTGTNQGYCYYYTASGNSNIFQYPWTYSGGAHTHSGGWVQYVSYHVPKNATFPLYKLGATVLPTKYIPAGSLVFTPPSSTLGSGWTPHSLSNSSYNYVAGSTVSPSVSGGNTLSITGTTSLTGGHRHEGGNLTWNHNLVNTTAAKLPEYDTTVAALKHSHNFTTTLTITMKARYVKAWVSTQDEDILEDMSIMFDGNVVDIPGGWKPCDGSNGTLDLRDYFPQYNTVDGSTNASMTGTTPSVVSSSWTHNHIDEPASSGLTGTLSTKTFRHGNYNATHSHSPSSVTISQHPTEDFRPQRVSVLFLQYKG